jgi:hypothetical protein
MKMLVRATAMPIGDTVALNLEHASQLQLQYAAVTTYGPGLSMPRAKLKQNLRRALYRFDLSAYFFQAIGAVVHLCIGCSSPVPARTKKNRHDPQMRAMAATGEESYPSNRYRRAAPDLVHSQLTCHAAESVAQCGCCRRRKPQACETVQICVVRLSLLAILVRRHSLSSLSLR